METLMERTPIKLNQQQLDMLQLLDKPLSDDDYAELKKELFKYLPGNLIWIWKN